jgi:hypothetical protein
VWPRPEVHGFTKFLLSIGAFLCVAAVVTPALILRDTGVLMVPERTLRGLTPIAQKEIRSRQGSAHDLGRAAPFIGIALMAGGLGLLGYGLPRLRRQEDRDEEKASMEIDKLQSELKPQSAEEEQAKLEAIVDEASPSEQVEGRTPPPDREMPTLAPTPKDARTDRMRRVHEIQEQIFDRLDEVIPPTYTLRRRVKIDGTPNLLVDGVLVSTVGQLPDILVEIKLSDGRFISPNIRNRVADALLRLTTYRHRLERKTAAWLIVVYETPMPVGVREQVLERVSEFGDDVRLTLLESGEISRLTLPFK